MTVTLSIVVVTWRDEPGLRATLGSIESFSRADDVQVLVCDGGSDYLTPEFCAEFADVEFSSMPDTGIYDAMNRGLSMSRGDLVWFLNGGDTSLVARHELPVEDLTAQQIHLFGYELGGITHPHVRKPRPYLYLYHALPTSHQAILYPGALARSSPYPEGFDICGDYAFTAQLFARSARFHRHPQPIARFDVGGTSTLRSREIAQQAAVVQAELLESPRVVRLASAALHRLSDWRRGRMIAPGPDGGQLDASE